MARISLVLQTNKEIGPYPELAEHCSNQGVKWRFTPEHAPHFGGLWEAAVKSFKTHLRRVVGKAKLTYEELATTLAQFEACLNSRPLTPLPQSSDALEVLTQGHFLIGKPLMALLTRPRRTNLLHCFGDGTFAKN